MNTMVYESRAKRVTVPLRLVSLYKYFRGRCIQVHLLLIVTIITAGILGCGGEITGEESQPIVEPNIAMTAEQLDLSDELTSVVNDDRQLVIWAPPFFQSSTESTTDDPFAMIYTQFEREHPGVHVDVQIRAENGTAGILHYLRGAERLAPAILPDVILIDTQQLWQAADLEIFMPLQRTQLFTNTELFPELVPAANYNGRFLGIPYFVDMTHALYAGNQLSTLPSSWEELLETQLPYIFSGGKSDAVNEFVYLQYLGAGGDFTTESLISEAQLHTLFSLLSQARSANVLSEALLDLTSQERAWEEFIAIDEALLETSSHFMLLHWDAISSESIQYETAPTLDGRNIALAQVWAFAIVAAEPEQQELSLSLVSAFLDPASHSKLSHQVSYIPTQPAAFELWRGPSPYFEFLQAQLEHVVPLPNERYFSDLSRRLQYVLDLILRGEMSAEEAVLYLQTAP